MSENQHITTMKTAHLSLLLFLGTMLFAGQARAASDDAPAPSTANSRAMERAVMHQIDRHVIFPLDAEGAEMYGVVDVAFAVDVKGRLVVKEASSRNAELRDYVVRKLGKIQVGANPSGLWNTTHLRFTFKPEHGGL